MCKCGHPLKVIEAGIAYKWASFVLCDGCDKKCENETLIYHCPRDKQLNHKSGYDYCLDCAKKYQIKKSEYPLLNNSNKKCPRNKKKMVPPPMMKFMPSPISGMQSMGGLHSPPGGFPPMPPHMIFYIMECIKYYNNTYGIEQQKSEKVKECGCKCKCSKTKKVKKSKKSKKKKKSKNNKDELKELLEKEQEQGKKQEQEQEKEQEQEQKQKQEKEEPVKKQKKEKEIVDDKQFNEQSNDFFDSVKSPIINKNIFENNVINDENIFNIDEIYDNDDNTNENIYKDDEDIDFDHEDFTKQIKKEIKLQEMKERNIFSLNNDIVIEEEENYGNHNNNNNNNKKEEDIKKQKIEPKKDDFKYWTEFLLTKEMGFNKIDDDILQQLLIQYKGDIQSVVNDILN